MQEAVLEKESSISNPATKTSKMETQFFALRDWYICSSEMPLHG
jgi:hypothetical protein